MACCCAEQVFFADLKDVDRDNEVNRCAHHVHAWHGRSMPLSPRRPHSRTPCLPLAGRRILWAFKLNPFEKLNLRFDAPIEEVRKQYRKVSLMVHPDKCKHPQASAAFDRESREGQSLRSRTSLSPQCPHGAR